MALSSETRRSPRYIGTGSETIFPFAFKLLKPTDLEVRVALSGQVETTLEESAYTVVLNESQDNNPGGTVTLKAPLAKDAALVIISDTPYLQPTTYTNRGGFYPEQLNTNLDRLTILTQQLKEHLDRTITVPPTSPTSPQELFYQLLNAAKEALESAQSAEEALAACEQIRQLIEQYSWDIPHLADNLQQVADYPYDGYFWVSGFGKVPPGQDISNRYVKANGSTTQRTLGERFADVVNVRDFGAVGNGTTDDTEAIQKAINVSVIKKASCFIPSGDYLISKDIYLPSNCCVYGDGRNATKIHVSQSAPIVTDGFCNKGRYNAKYNDIPQTEYDENINLSGMSIYMYGWDRAEQTDDSYGGCGVKLAGVKDANVFYVTVYDPVLHGFDCATFALKNNYSVGHFNYDAVSGGCERVRFFQTTTHNPVVDDGLTTHFARNVFISNHTSIYDREGVTVQYHQHGIELDGGNDGVVVSDCYSYGYGAGYAAGGHHEEPPARNLTFSNCIAECCAIGLTLENNPTEISVEERAEKTCARNVQIKNLTLRNLYYNTSGLIGRIEPLIVLGYANVSVDGVLIQGVDARHATEYGVQCSLNSYYSNYKNISFVDFVIDSEISEYYGVIKFYSTNATAAHNRLENIFFDNVKNYQYLVRDEVGGLDSIVNCHVNKQTGLTRGIYSVNPNLILQEIDIPDVNNGVQGNSVRNINSRNAFVNGMDTCQSLTSSFLGKNRPHIRLGEGYLSNGGHIGYKGQQFFIGTWDEDAQAFACKAYLNTSYALCPGNDNVQAIGTAATRWQQLYAGTGSINTSDARLKTSLQAPTDALMRAWGKVNYQIFQFTDAVEKKGADARLHVGLIAQQVIEAFNSEGLDSTRYGLLCYDEWDDQYEDVEVVDQPEVLDEAGEVLTPAVTHIEHRKVLNAGNRYGIRYEEALALEAAYQRWQLNQLRKLVVGAA